MKKVFLIFQLLLVVMLAQAQMMNPVKFISSLKTDGSAVAEIVFSGKIQPGWHVYSTGLGGDGPISASFNVNKLEGVELVGKLQPRGREIAKFDPLFGAKGMDWMYANCSTTAQRGALDWAPRFREAIKPVMEWLYYSVKTGNEAQISIDKNSQADYREKLNAELEAMRNKEMWQAGVTVRKLRPENN